MVIFTVLSILTYTYFEFQRPPSVNTHNSISDDKLSADELISMFTHDEKFANNTYVEKTIEVKGVVKNISSMNNRQTILLQSEQFKKNFVLCDMMPFGENQVEKISVGDTIILKGVCKGFLLDVIMLNCIPIDYNK